MIKTRCNSLCRITKGSPSHWILRFVVLSLAWQVGCHNLAPKSTMRALPEARSAQQALSPQQIYPTSRLQSGVNNPATAAHGAGCGGACCQSRAYRPAFPELNQAGCSPENCQSAPFGNDFNCPLPYQARHIDPQEYVYDGGDRDPQARLREDLSVAGLDSEDTVIRFETQSGSVELQAGCRVPIYAPRFASTRKITPVSHSDHVVATQAALHDQKIGRMADALPPTKVRLSSGPQREETVKVVEAVRDRNRGVLMDRVLPAIGISDAFKPYEDLQIIRKGTFAIDDKVKLRSSIMAARSWSSVEELVVMVDNVEVELIEESSGTEEVLTYELAGKPRVRLCKVASHQVAEPGDTIDFTIRFDNIGDQKINNIVVHDSLAPRLEYIDDSQKTSLKSDFASQANDAGSSVLTWTFKETVRAGQGGYIRFQCKVR